MQKSASLKYEPSSELLLITAKQSSLSGCTSPPSEPLRPLRVSGTRDTDARDGDSDTRAG